MLLDTPIKTIGLYTVQIALHPEVVVPVTLNVARSQDEADAQSRGEVLTGPFRNVPKRLLAAEELFEAEAAAEAATRSERRREVSQLLTGRTEPTIERALPSVRGPFLLRICHAVALTAPDPHALWHAPRLAIHA